MSLETTDVAHLLMALAALLLAAHAVGSVFVRFRQPRAIGEVVGGLMLGATVFARRPVGSHGLFASNANATVLSAVNELGLLLLLFITGTEIRRVFHRDERRTVGAVFATGMVIPFLAGVGILQLTNLHRMWGPNGNSTSFLLVFAIAMAVTSIPVISRIMHDLGILDTTFARVVLGVAVLEDLVLYVVLAVAIGYAGARSGTLFGLPDVLGISGGTTADMLYHIVATLAFLVICH